MKVLSGIFRGLACIVYLVIILSLLIAAPLLLGNKPVVVLSGSMEPKYPVGSVTYYKKSAFEDIAVGDAITFQIGDNSLATHRVTAIDTVDQTFTTKGDNNDTEDAVAVSYDEVRGKTAAIAIPFAGYFVNYVQRWYVLVTCGGVLVLDMLLSPEKTAKEPSVGEKVLEDLLRSSDDTQ